MMRAGLSPMASEREPCAHIAAVHAVTHPGARLRRVRQDRLVLGTPPDVSDVRRDALLRLVIASAEPGERWLYCYPDDAFAEY